MLKRVYIEVVTKFDTLGNMRPQSLKWTDGKVYEIERIKYVGLSASTTGGSHLRYTCIIEKKERYLFAEVFYNSRDLAVKWFLEVKE